MLLSPNAEVVILYRTDVFSEWTNWIGSIYVYLVKKPI